jgi:hypothetical protein
MQTAKRITAGTAIIAGASAIYYTAITARTYPQDSQLYNFVFMPEGRYIGVSKEKITLLARTRKPQCDTTTPSRRYYIDSATCRVDFYWKDWNIILQHGNHDDNDTNSLSVCMTQYNYNLARFKNYRAV